MTTTTQPAPAPLALDDTPTGPTKDDVITAICAETRCSRGKAKRFLNWIENAVACSRNQGYTPHYLDEGELKRHHRILETIAPDGTVAQPDTAHALVEHLVLDRTKGELGLIHDFVDDQDSDRYCTMEVRLSVAKLN